MLELKVVGVCSLLSLLGCASELGANDGKPNERWCDQSIVYLNRAGTTLHNGDLPDSVADILPLGPTLTELVVPPAEVSGGEWNDVVACVRAHLQPLGVSVVENDPGAVGHLEVLVGGNGDEIGGMGGGLASRADGCTTPKRPLNWVWPSRTQLELCHAVMWGIGRTFGARPVLEPSDFMSIELVEKTGFADGERTCGYAGQPQPCVCGEGDERTTHDNLAQVMSNINASCN